MLIDRSLKEILKIIKSGVWKKRKKIFFLICLRHTKLSYVSIDFVALESTRNEMEKSIRMISPFHSSFCLMSLFSVYIYFFSFLQVLPHFHR